MKNENKELATSYQPAEIEAKWNRFWVEKRFFEAGQDLTKEPFSIVIPPPNVTGNLHIGHAFDFTLQDIVARFKRMQGYDTLWLPGMDHAGIATQAVVERKLHDEGKNRYDLGREKFLELTWEWSEKYAAIIREQWGELGLSLDYSRERFTLDEGLSNAVRHVFVGLYEKGLIYRGKYIINWDPQAQTALSDIEVEYKDVKGTLYHLRYPLKDGTGSITVATTRPETMLGDTAVAVHPADERYQHLIGKILILPITGREVPIIADDFVEREFGSGAVKVTPAHDPNDFEIGNRHNLPRVLVMDEAGVMNENAGKYQGQDRFLCRKNIVADLQKQGVLFEIEEHEHSVGHSQRTGAVIEPYLSTQWFVSMGPLAQKAIASQKSAAGVKFVPERFERTYLHWIENIRDWCISRQLWWGHRIPAWYCDECEEIIVQLDAPTECPSCHNAKLRQDEDVLDTWFSSGIWPFSTMGWPEETEDLERFYPTSLLVTGYDIIFFWVARMIFMALEFTEEIPFKDIYIHGLVRDSQGRKMSKSLGNGIDPLEVIEKYGADPLRFMLSTGTAPGQDMRFHYERVEAAGNFANKLWNAARYVIMNLDGFKPVELQITADLLTADRWIIHRYNETVKEVTRLFDQYDFGEAGRVLQHFIWDEFCDWYIELSKLSLYSDKAQEKERSKGVLTYILDNTLRLLHPFMPFITEELWQQLPVDGPSITVASWPLYREDFVDQTSAKEMSLAMDLIRAVRNIRSEANVPPSRKVEIIIKPTSAANLEILKKNKEYIKRFANPEDLTIELAAEAPEEAMSAVITGAEIYLPLAGLIDTKQELERLEKELVELDFEVERVQQKLANKNFTDRAPAKVVAEERAKELDYLAKRAKVKERLEGVRRLGK